MKKRLYRSPDTALIGGVLAGMADYFNQDVVWWRLGFITALVLTGLMPGVLLYLIAWVIIPLRPLIEPVDQSDYQVVHE